MHDEAKTWVARLADGLGFPSHPLQLSAADLGGRETNGHARDVFGPNVNWVVVDMVDGPGVDIVESAVTYGNDNTYDLVMCAEVFEHTPHWASIIHNVHRILVPDGYFITTMAGPGRDVHGVNHDDPDQPGWYQNIEAVWLRLALQTAGFRQVDVEENVESHDVYGWAQK